MTKFSIGYNHTKTFIEMIPLVSTHVNEIYFQAPTKIMTSGRVIISEKNYQKNIEKIIELCKKNNIKSNILLNATCEGKNIGDERNILKIIDYLKKLEIIGLKAVTITNPMHISKIKKEIPSLEIHSSINCYVKTVEHAKYLKDLGVDVITIDRDINRDIELIKKIKKATNTKIKILLNEGCLKDCPFRQVHFNMISHKKDTDYFDKNSCVSIYKINPKKVFKIPFIRPEDLKHYENIIDIFKLSTRTSPTVKIIHMLDSYKNEKHNGNMLNLLSTRGLFSYFKEMDNNVLNDAKFFEKMTSCDDNCEKCDYCDKLLKKAMTRVENNS